jgi:hypothetical protein
MPGFLESADNSTRYLGWVLMYPRVGQLSAGNGALEVEHLRLRRGLPEKEMSFLPVSVKVLFDDYLTTCEHFAKALDDEAVIGGSELLQRWHQTDNALMAADITTTLRW